MNDLDASETEEWRVRDRQLQGLVSRRQRRAQAVVDVGESAKGRARHTGSNPLDELLELYLRVASPAAKQMVADSIFYVKAERDLERPFRLGGIVFQKT